MGKYKICVYAVSRNQAAFVRRWMDSMAEADEVWVLDAGSADGTAERLRDLGARVTAEPVPSWRFLTARNRALDQVPLDTDICVYTSLDELLRPGWREKVEEAWAPGTTRLRCRYIPDRQETAVEWKDTIHRRRGCWWAGETLNFDGGEIGPRYAEGVVLEHRPGL